MSADIFEKIQANRGPIGQHAKESHGYFTFPKLEGPIGPHMIFRGKTRLNWSLNNYLGLADHPEVRKIDGEAAADYGFGSPMGARMMSGNSDHHEQLERELSAFVNKETDCKKVESDLSSFSGLSTKDLIALSNSCKFW